MSAPKTYAEYARRAVDRGESPLPRDEWNRRKANRSAAANHRADKEIDELEKLADSGDSQAQAELRELDDE